MEQRGALDDGFPSMSRRQIRQLRREFAKLDRLGGWDGPLLEVPPQGQPPQASATEGGAGATVSVRDAVVRIRWSVVFLLLTGVLMMIATVLPTGWGEHDGVEPPTRTTPASSAPRFGTPPPSEAPTAPTFTFEGPFGP